MPTYNRATAVAYAHRHALAPNPAYHDFAKLGGDCTNFVSQCLFAGYPQMDFAPDGWYYRGLDSRSPSWTGVEPLHSYLTRSRSSSGLGASSEVLANTADIARAETGDVVQLSFDGVRFAHSMLVVETGGAAGILVAARTLDRNFYPLSACDFKLAHLLKMD